MIRGRKGLGWAGVLLVMGVSGCSLLGDSDELTGFAGQSGRTIALEGFADTKDVRAMRVAGTVPIDGKLTRINVRTDRTGRCSGRMTQGKSVSMFISTPKAAFLKGNAEFWRQKGGKEEDQVVAWMDERWARTSPSPDLDRMCRLGHKTFKDLQASFRKDKTAGANVEGLNYVGDFETVELNEGGNDPRIGIMVSVAKPHYVRQFVSRDDNVTLTFSGFKRPTPVQAPGQFVDIGK